LTLREQTALAGKGRKQEMPAISAYSVIFSLSLAAMRQLLMIESALKRNGLFQYGCLSQTFIHVTVLDC